MDDTISFGQAPFTIRNESTYTLVALFGALDGHVAREFEKKAALFSHEKDVIIDFKECTGLQRAFVRPFAVLSTELKKTGRYLRFAEISPDVRRFFFDQGISQVVRFSDSVETAIRESEMTD